MNETVVEVRGITRRFGAKTALDGVSLSLAAGSVTGLVGENGAGKTTLIRHLLGLLKPQEGSVRVFGLDPVREPAAVLSRVGYLSEEVDLPAWMRVQELLCYSAAFYPTWDDDFALRLLKEFALDPAARVRDLSKGQRARAGLLVALAYRPPLLVLDEPSSGLDPIVRRDILAAVIRSVADAGRTVLFSSHLLGEVERVSDRVAMIRAGKVLFCEPVDALRERHRRVTLRFETPRAAPPELAGALAWDGAGREWTALWSGSPPQLDAAAAVLDARIVDQGFPTLDEIFVARTLTGAAAEAR